MPPKQKADTAGYQQLKRIWPGESRGGSIFSTGRRLSEGPLPGAAEGAAAHRGDGGIQPPYHPARRCPPPAWRRRWTACHDGAPDLVLVRDFDLFKAGEKDREEYARAFAQLPDYCCLVFVYDLIPYKGDARTKLAAAIQAHGTVVNFARQETGELVKWVRRRFRAWARTSTAIWPRSSSSCAGLMTNLIGRSRRSGPTPRARRSPGRTSTRWPPPSWTRWCSV